MPQEGQNDKLNETLSEINVTLDKLCVALGLPRRSRRKLFWRNFISGLARGIGMAIGFTILSAAIVAFLTFLAGRNLPVIGEFIADVVRRVQGYMR